ncbi:molybdopterin dinucleotide binding domain-containing protein [Actinomadura sp. 6N118]|uniref:molybdopterin dinucleotide binding domain-containing protein n=1 Tax=Actinomadura sp. 6N118 TaxID=3375151 RepID=UPI0037B857D2
MPDTPTTHTSDDYPFVLVAGQRRAFTANTIFRDTTWRRRDPDGAVRISPPDAERLHISDGDHVVITTARGRAVSKAEIDDRLQPGHACLPNQPQHDPIASRSTEQAWRSTNSPTPDDATPSPPLPGTNTCQRASNGSTSLPPPPKHPSRVS